MALEKGTLLCGNKLAKRYSITTYGVICVYLGKGQYNTIRVKVLNGDGYSYNVDEMCFEPYTVN